MPVRAACVVMLRYRLRPLTAQAVLDFACAGAACVVTLRYRLRPLTAQASAARRANQPSPGSAKPW
ncbi:Uncharacterised protein [Nocardia farcinica]|nr:Uncharacterised protein [Nocardia farcinica]